MATETKAKQTVLTPIFRVSYEHLFKPSEPEGSDVPVYQVTAIFDADADLKPLQKMINQAKKDKWKDKIPANFRSPFRKGVTLEKDENGYDLDKNPEYAGKIICVFKSYGQPVPIVDANKNDIIDKRHFYSGCWAVANVSAFAWSKKGKNGVSLGLNAVMKIKDDEPLSARMTAQKAFQDVDVSNYGVDNSGQFENDEDNEIAF